MDKPRLSIVLSTHATQFGAVALKGDFDTNLEKIAAWGYQGVELAIRDPGLVDPEVLGQLLIQHKLLVPAIGTGQAWGEERLSFTSDDAEKRRLAIERIKKHLPLAKRFNSLVIIGLIRGVSPPGQAHSRSVELLRAAMGECTEAATGLGVRLALEPLNRYETDLIRTVDEGLELIHQVGSATLGLLLDTFHMNIEEVKIEESIRKCQGHIFHFHVADSNRWHPGAGHLDFKSIIGALRSTGYQGWISGEFMPIPDAETAAEKNITFLQRL